MGRSFQLWINNKWKSYCKVEWKRDYEKHSCSRWLYSRSRHVVDHTVNGDARGRVGGIQMFAQERAVVDLQTLPLQVQLLSDHQHITIIQVMHQLQHTRPAGYTNTHARTHTVTQAQIRSGKYMTSRRIHKQPLIVYEFNFDDLLFHYPWLWIR